MTQPLDIINGALSAMGALAPGETLDAALAADAFNMLNDMLDLESNENFMIYNIIEIIAPSIAGQTAWTIGPGGEINSIRPLNIHSAFVRVSGIDFTIAIINLEKYELIGLKQLSGPWPKALYYQPTYPLGTINLWPLPASGELHLFASNLFTRFSTINDTVEFPPGYQMWMKFSLAAYLAPGYGKGAMVQLLSGFASEAKAKIKISNMVPQQTVGFDPIIASRGINAQWIMSGGFL